MIKLTTYAFITIGLTVSIFSALQFVSRKKVAVNYWLGVLFLCFGYIWLYFGFYRATRFSWAPWLLYSDVLVTFLLGPSLYRYTLALAGMSSGRRLPLRLLPFLPVLGVLAYLIAARPYLSLPVVALSGLDPEYTAVPAVNVINTIGDAYFLCFAVVSTAIVVRFYRASDRGVRRAFRGVLAYYIIGLSTFAIFFAGHALRQDSLLALATLINGVNSTYFFFYSYRYPEYSQRTIRLPQMGHVRPATTNGEVDVQRILKRLELVMEGSEGYRDPKITLQSLSARLGLQYFQLSQILNDDLGTSFRTYINTRRLAKARLLLVEKPVMSILEIAFDVGFNSKSAFNTAFLKENGISPRDFRKKASKNIQLS
jgi:AraC-like DNA-binding protein